MRMKAKYSPSSHRIAVTPPKPTTREKSSARFDVGAEQRRGDRTAQECPIHEVVRIVPPVDRVVEVECVADRVDEEREYE